MASFISSFASRDWSPTSLVIKPQLLFQSSQSFCSSNPHASITQSPTSLKNSSGTRAAIVSQQEMAALSHIFDHFDENKDGKISCDELCHSLEMLMECAGDASLQNALDLARGVLTQIPSYGYREVLIIYSALSTCDPGDIMDTLAKCKEAKIRCSVVGLSAEIYICKLLCERTGGMYSIAINEGHRAKSHARPQYTHSQSIQHTQHINFISLLAAAARYFNHLHTLDSTHTLIILHTHTALLPSFSLYHTHTHFELLHTP